MDFDAVDEKRKRRIQGREEGKVREGTMMPLREPMQGSIGGGGGVGKVWCGSKYCVCDTNR